MVLPYRPSERQHKDFVQKSGDSTQYLWFVGWVPGVFLAELLLWWSKLNPVIPPPWNPIPVDETGAQYLC